MTDSVGRTFSAPDLSQLYDDWELSGTLVLPENPLIVVAGAYQGKLMRLLAEMFPRYKALVGYEPQQWAFTRAAEALANTPRVSLYNIGLLAETTRRDLPMGEWGTDAASLHTTDRAQGEGHFEDARILLGAHKQTDLLVMNLEGYEYQLIPYLVRWNLLDGRHIRRLAVQFHTRYAPEGPLNVFAAMDEHYGRRYDNYPRWVYWVTRK